MKDFSYTNSEKNNNVFEKKENQYVERYQGDLVTVGRDSLP